jgi:hypothetical protein
MPLLLDFFGDYEAGDRRLVVSPGQLVRSRKKSSDSIRGTVDGVMEIGLF